MPRTKIFVHKVMRRKGGPSSSGYPGEAQGHIISKEKIKKGGRNWRYRPYRVKRGGGSYTLDREDACEGFPGGERRGESQQARRGGKSERRGRLQGLGPFRKGSQREKGVILRFRKESI